MRTNRITFRKGKLYSGLMRLPATYRVNRAGEEIAIIQENRDGSWFWYGAGENTYARRCTLEECKQQIKDHFKVVPEAAPSTGESEITSVFGPS